MITDSNKMFDVIKKDSHTAKKRLLIDIDETREAKKEKERCIVGLVRSENNVADDLTKVKH